MMKFWNFLIVLFTKWGWLLRVIVAYEMLSFLMPTAPRAPLGPQQIAEPDKPQLCVHTRLIDEVYEWKIQRSLQMVREMGASTIVEFFPWAYAEVARGIYDWASFDVIVKHARNQGLHIIARIGLVPEWAQNLSNDSVNSTLNYLPEAAYGDFAAFVAAFAERYAGVIDHIIIWNEPNLSFEWGYRQVDPAGYMSLLKSVYSPAHQANPAVKILAAPLAPTLEPRGSQNGLNDILYLQDLFEVGAGAYFDALAMHTYGFTDAPEVSPDPERLNFRRAELLHDIMIKYGEGDKPVYITETGWNDSPRWTKAVRPSLRVAYTVNAFRWAERNWPWVTNLCLWVLRYPANTRSYPDYFTMITPDFQPMPIYNAVQSYARGWEQDEQLWLPAPGQ